MCIRDRQYGFVDRVYSSGMKVAASVQLSNAKEKINQSLLIKLEFKMNLFWNKTKTEAPIMNVLALKDGKSLLINASDAASGVEVAPLGAATLDDGQYELADGRKITVTTDANGVQTIELVESMTEVESQANIIDTVAAMLVKSEAKIEAMVQAKLKPLEVLSSSHKPVKSNGAIASPVVASINDDLQTKVEAKMQEQRAAVESKRKGVV